ncbi:YaeQ family protein [Zhongshania aquimaris]|uniref:YaeQ family protein n=1 Tax=Zhongshania aquimaris TaxID=2857107 RepID=A0ABS6VPS6_9GAMM|nr:YaeQ family protein [Zhongshania aquimaris]MBW2939775.1 YaeQ family protein [Zhongshania aquimaris]
MALNATLFKTTLDISDLRRHYYQRHQFTVARHPSETGERMMLRILAFALYADEHLEFTKGLSTDDEPDLWQKSLTGEIDLWIEMGLPSEKRVRKARAIAKQVIIFIYGGRTAQMWWDENRSKVLQHSNVKIIEISAEDSGALRDIAQRTMRLQCTIDEDSVWFSDDANNIEIRLIEHC